MSKNGLDLEGIRIDAAGRVVLDDGQLDQLAASYDATTAGATGGTNSNMCSNSASCGGSTNGSCTNTRGACNDTTNFACRERPYIEIQ